MGTSLTQTVVFPTKMVVLATKMNPRWEFHLQILCGWQITFGFNLQSLWYLHIMYHEQHGGLHVWTYSNMFAKATHVTLKKKKKKTSIWPRRRAHCSSWCFFKSLHLILFCCSMACFFGWSQLPVFQKYGSWKWTLQWIQRSILVHFTPLRSQPRSILKALNQVSMKTNENYITSTYHNCSVASRECASSMQVQCSVKCACKSQCQSTPTHRKCSVASTRPANASEQSLS